MDFASYENVSRYLLTLFMMDVKNSFDLLEMFQDNIFFYKLSPWMTTCESFFYDDISKFISNKFRPLFIV